MSVSLSDIKAPIAHEMEEFEKKFRDAMRTKVALLDRIMTYIVKRKGKQMRPMLVFLSAGVCGGITEKTYRGASLVELLHTATLIHDDVVDDSLQRRSFFSINALWKNKIAVLVGDYLLSRGLLLSVDNNDFDLLKISSEAVKAMSEGELLQLEKSRMLNFSEEVYFDIIRMKTASLIACCCAMGARSTNSEVEVIEKMRLFGEKVGIAFQIKDDLFDYTEGTGKPKGIDIKEKKLTLPMIYALNNVEKSERKKVIHSIKNFDSGKQAIAFMTNFVVNNGGVKYAEETMAKYQQEAIEILNTLQDSNYRKALADLVAFTTKRMN
ncbi:MAG: polyprenyl synthetase family protein [Bacteroidetes bacterium]|nr:polyprenyl synthetase family protein [Bacteroidota bacterium]